jgi:hypothetical protein
VWRRNPVEEVLADTVCDTCSLGQESLTEKTRVAYHCSSILVEEGTTLSESALYGDAVEAFECILGENKFEDTRDEASHGLVEQVSCLRASTNTTKACQCGRHVPHIPQFDPSKWPQAPLLLRPKPDGGTRVLGIRKEANHKDFLWKPGQVEQWWDVLRKEWDPTYSRSEDDVAQQQKFCEHCVILPINNGMEKPGEALVVDFESPLFEGTLMLRVKGTNGTTMPRNDNDGDDGSYFSDKVIRYQTVLRGRFKKELPFFSLVTGYRFRRSCGKLPPNFVMWATMHVVHFFAPQLSMRLEKCNRPYVLSPFGSAPRTIIIEDSNIEPGNSNGVMTRDLSEPKEASQSILARDNPIQNSLERARARKKQMDQSFISQSATPTTDPDKLYTFEFLQHLFDYQKFQIDVSQSIHAKLKDILNGQPLQIMAASSLKAEQEWSIDNEIFAFEIWNECLLHDAQAHLEI